MTLKLKKKKYTSHVGMICRLKCLKTIRATYPTDGINFIIVEENRSTFGIMLPSVSPELLMRVNKKEVYV